MTDATTAERPTRPDPAGPAVLAATPRAPSTGAGCAGRRPAGRWAPRSSAPSARRSAPSSPARSPRARPRTLVWLLALCVVGGAVLDTAGPHRLGRRSSTGPRAGCAATCSTPRSTSRWPRCREQAVGEVLDRVDDDTHEVGALLRRQVWDALRTVFAALPMWVVAGLTWWPAWFLFPLFGYGRRASSCAAAARDHAAQGRSRRWPGPTTPPRMEEGIAGRDDLRTSLGQAHVVRRVAELSAAVHRRFADLLRLEATVTRRAGLLLHALLAGIAWPGSRSSSTATCRWRAWSRCSWSPPPSWARSTRSPAHLPDLQAGLGAVIRLRQLLEAEPEPTGGLPAARGLARPRAPRPALRLRRGHVRAARRRPARAGRPHLRPGRPHRLRQVDAGLPGLAGRRARARHRCSSAASTCSTSTCSSCAPPSAWSPSAPRSSPARLAENIALFADVPARAGRGRRRRARPRRLGRRPARGLDTAARARRHHPVGRRGAAGRLRPAAGARRAGRGARRGHRPDGPAHRGARRAAPPTGCSRGRTGLLVAHRLSTTARAEHVAVLEAGRVVQQGPRAELAERPGPFRRPARRQPGDELDDGPARRRPVTTARRGRREAGPSAAAVGGARRTGEPPGAARGRHRPEPGPRHHPAPCWSTRGGALFAAVLFLLRPWSAPSVRSPAASGATSCRTSRRAGRHPPCGSRWRSRLSLHGRAAPPRRGDPALPALVDRGHAARADVGARRPDRAAPPGPHAARRGRRPLDGRRPLRPLRRPLGRLHQRPRHRRRHRVAGPEPARRRRAARRDGRLGRRLVGGPPDRRSLGHGVVRGPGPVRPLAGLGARVRAHGQARRRDPVGAPPPARGSTAAASRRRCSSTACRPCSTASRS